MADHPQCILHGINIDREMAPLLEALWERGYTTDFSCQGSPEVEGEHNAMDAYISFPEMIDALAFLQKVKIIGWTEFYLHAGRYRMELGNRGGAVIRFGHDMLALTIAVFTRDDLSVYLGSEVDRQAKERVLRAANGDWSGYKPPGVFLTELTKPHSQPQLAEDSSL